MQVDVKISQGKMPAIYRRGFFFDDEILPERPGWIVSVRVVFDQQEKTSIDVMGWRDRSFFLRNVSHLLDQAETSEERMYLMGGGSIYVRDLFDGHWCEVEPPSPSLEEANSVERNFLRYAKTFKGVLDLENPNSPRTKSYKI